MKYYNDKRKIIALIILIAGIAIIGTVFEVLLIQNISMKYVSIIMMCSFCGCIIAKVTTNFNVELTIDSQHITSYRNGEYKEILWKNVKSIRYRGICCIPFFDIIAVFDNSGKMIFVDYNFQNYVSIWTTIIKMCDDNNTKIYVDNRILEKIKKKNT